MPNIELEVSFMRTGNDRTKGIDAGHRCCHFYFAEVSAVDLTCHGGTLYSEKEKQKSVPYILITVITTSAKYYRYKDLEQKHNIVIARKANLRF